MLFGRTSRDLTTTSLPGVLHKDQGDLKGNVSKAQTTAVNRLMTGNAQTLYIITRNLFLKA